MPFGVKFDELVNKGRARLDGVLGGSSSQQQQHYSQQQYQQYPSQQYPPYQQQQHFYQGSQPGFPGGNQPPPPVPTGTKPQAANSAYFAPTFHSSQPVSATFRHEQGAHGWGNNELQNYTDSGDNSFHTPNGLLVLRAVVNSGAPDGSKYTSARLTTHQTLARDRGCLTVRLTPPCAPGVWPAFWLLPQDPFAWPTDGEVDIFESWNGDRVNHTCLHWGHFNGEDASKHRVVENHLPDMDHPAGHVFAFAWDQPQHGHGGRMVWYIDGRPAMKAEIPAGTRPLRDYRVIANVAIGGNVCGGQVPRDGSYDLVIHELRFEDHPPGGWDGFNGAYHHAPEGHGM